MATMNHDGTPYIASIQDIEEIEGELVIHSAHIYTGDRGYQPVEYCDLDNGQYSLQDLLQAFIGVGGYSRVRIRIEGIEDGEAVR